MAPSDIPALHCRGLTKRYAGVTVLDHVDLELASGEILGFLGPNGAGKTTLIKSVLGLVTPDDGEVAVFGIDALANRRAAIRQVGAVVEAPIFFEYLSALDNLRHLTSLTKTVPEAALLAALAGVGLREVANRRVQTFSYGMKQRLGIAQALLPDARLLILDEPTNGLDPHGIAGMRILLRELAKNRGMAILISSHLLTEVEQVCDRFIILHKGRIVHQADATALQRRLDDVDVLLRSDPGVADKVRRHPRFRGLTTTESGALLCRFAVAPADVPELVRWLVQANAAVEQVNSRQCTLEDLFLEITAAGGRDVRSDTF